MTPKLGLAVAATAFLVSFTAARADTILWVDDINGNLGTVNLTTNAVTVIGNTGQILTDIAFTSNGTLYGTTFTDLYQINTTTAAATYIGPNGIGTMNALVGAGSGLLGAANGTLTVYSISTATGGVTTYASSGGTSAGDLAFANGILYEALSSNVLYDVTHAVAVGPMGVSNVYGIADDGTTMYAVAGTTVYTVNLATGALTALFDYGGHGLGTAYGEAFYGEAANVVPEPASMTLLGAGLLGLGWLRRRNKAN